MSGEKESADEARAEQAKLGKMEGYLVKHSVHQSKFIPGAFEWAKRYCVLDGNIFRYYTDSTKTVEKGRIDIFSGSSLQHHNYLGHGDCLEIDAILPRDSKQTWVGDVAKLVIQLPPEDRALWETAFNVAIKAYEDAPKYNGRCFCGNIEFEVAGPSGLELICHCQDCSYFQANTSNQMFQEGRVKVTKGEEHVGTFTHPRLNATHRVFCKQCGCYCFARATMFNMIGIPRDRLFVNTNPIPPIAPSMHVNYHNKRMVMKDGLPKFKDFPSAFGGSGIIMDDEGNEIGTDTQPSDGK